MNVIKKEKQFYEKMWLSLKGGFHKLDSHFASNKPNPEVVKFACFAKKKIKHGRFLDLGCGNGSNTIVFDKLGFESYGIDFSAEALKIAQKNASEKKADTKFKRGNVLELPYKDNQFDVLIDAGCLHHLRKHQWPDYLRNIIRVLKPDGYFFLQCFNIRTDLNTKGFKGMSQKKNWNKKNNHYNHVFRLEEIKEIFGKNFNFIEIKEVDHDNYPLWFWVIYMKRKQS